MSEGGDAKESPSGDEEKPSLPKNGDGDAKKPPPKRARRTAIEPPAVAPQPDDKRASESEAKQTFHPTDVAIDRKGRRLQNDKLGLQNKQLELENTRLRWNNRMRLCAAIGIFAVVLCWLVAVLGIIVAVLCVPKESRLSDTVIVALLATSSLNVIGLLRIVAVYLFPNAVNQPGEK